MREFSHPDEPWLSQGAIAFCNEQLRPEHVGLEWGSGRSTYWLAPRVGRLVSVENNEGWHGLVSQKLRERGLTNAECRFVPLEHDEYDPEPVFETPPPYVRVADEFADESLDFAVVDGSYRFPCIRAALPKLKPGGLLLVDNTDWFPSAAHWPVPSDWPIVHQSSNGVTQTTLWRKP